MFESESAPAIDQPGSRPSPSLHGPPADPGLVPIEALEREIGDLAAEINAATCRWLLLVAEFERRKGHEWAGFATCALWLAWRCSLTQRSAREQTRVARDLAGLPRIRAAFANGRLSYSKVRALTRVAEPETEADLLETAAHATASQLERLLSGYRYAITDAAEAQAQKRGLRTHWQEDGSLSIQGCLPPEEGALFLRALADCREAAEGATNADGLVAMAEGSLVDPDTGGLRGGERNQVIVHVDAAELAAGRGEPGAAEVSDGPVIPVETARRLGCDASVVVLVERDGVPVSVGRRTRSIPPAIARALRSRDRGCRFPGCGRQRFVDAHHVEHWARGGETSLGNLVQLCRHHHRLVHEGGFSVVAEDDGFAFLRPDRSRIEAAPEPAATGRGAPRQELGAPGRARREGPPPRYEPLDLDHAVTVLAAARELRRHGSARRLESMRC